MIMICTLYCYTVRGRIVVWGCKIIRINFWFLSFLQTNKQNKQTQTKAQQIFFKAHEIRWLGGCGYRLLNSLYIKKLIEYSNILEITSIEMYMNMRRYDRPTDRSTLEPLYTATTAYS